MWRTDELVAREQLTVEVSPVASDLDYGDLQVLFALRESLGYEQKIAHVKPTRSPRRKLRLGCDPGYNERDQLQPRRTVPSFTSSA
jgi:hypothetical protein